MTEAVRNIRSNRVSFLSIVIISMLAVTAYLGLAFSAEGMRRSTDATYEAEHTADIEISGNVMFSDQDLESVLKTEGVLEAEGIVSLPSRVSTGTEMKNVTLRSVPERIGTVHMLEGELPGAGNECAVEKTLADSMEYGIGDQIQLTGRSRPADMMIREKTYTVTGIFTSADHLTEMVSFEPYLLVTREAFSTMALPSDRYTRLLVRTGSDDPYRFSSVRMDAVDQVKGRLEQADSRWMAVALHRTAGYVCADEDAGLLATVSVTFSMLFVLIAALVIYSTIGRLVEHESRLVGAEKAMGLKNSEIFAKYLLFGAGGTLAGAAAGVLIAYFIFERIVLFFFGTVFYIWKWVAAFQTIPVITVILGAAALSFAAVFLACRKLLRSTAVSLMSGQNALGTRRKKGSSGNGALYLRLILRNMRTDWKRVLISIVSVAGCCMLMMIGFSLKYAISRVPERQYEQIQRFDMEITVDPSAGSSAMDGIRAVLDEKEMPYLSVYTAEMPYKAGEEPGMLSLICPESGADISSYYHFENALGGGALEVPESGMLVSRKFADQYDFQVGDRFLLYDAAANAHEVEVAGIVENYIGILAISGRNYAEACFEEKLSSNTLLMGGTVQDAEKLREELREIDGFVSLVSSRKQEALFNGLSVMLNLIILLMGLLALMIACFILLNLVSTYVNQKKNELVIMRINGYTTGETIRYASMECYGITLLGILLGLIAGQGFCSYLIRRIEQLSMGFVKDPFWISFAGSALVTAVISGGIHWFAFRKIRSLKLSDIEK